MSVLIKGMEMPTTGLYFASVDNTGGRDKTVVTVERMLGNRDVRQIVGSFELIPVPPHGRLIDADALVDKHFGKEFLTKVMTADEGDLGTALVNVPLVINNAPIIIPSSKED